MRTDVNKKLLKEVVREILLEDAAVRKAFLNDYKELVENSSEARDERLKQRLMEDFQNNDEMTRAMA